MARCACCCENGQLTDQSCRRQLRSDRWHQHRASYIAGSGPPDRGERRCGSIDRCRQDPRQQGRDLRLQRPDRRPWRHDRHGHRRPGQGRAHSPAGRGLRRRPAGHHRSHDRGGLRR